MVIYPTGENLTKGTSQPWGAVILILLSLAGYFALVLPRESRFSELQEEQLHVLHTALEDQLGQGELKQGIYFQAIKNPHLVADPEYANSFDDAVHRAYADYSSAVQPLTLIAKSDAGKRLILALMPHHWALLILGVLCLFFTNYLLEHLFDKLWVMSLTVVVAMSWFVFPFFIPAGFAPSLEFAWAYTMATLMMISCVLGPKVQLEVTFKTWFFRFVELRTKVPIWLFSLTFVLAVYVVTGYVSGYANLFDEKSLILIGVEALLLALVFSFLPTREILEDRDPEVHTNRELARVEMFLDEERRDEAMAILRELVQNPTNEEQVRRIADIAFTHDNNEIATLAFSYLLREANKKQDHNGSRNVLEDMLRHDLDVPGHLLTRTMEMAVNKGELTAARRLVPYVLDHPEIMEDQAMDLVGTMIDKIMLQQRPDRAYLYDLLGTLKAKSPNHPILEKLSLFLDKTAKSLEDESHVIFHDKVHSHIDVVLRQVDNDHIHMTLSNGKEQKVPWTAFLAIYGCHLLGTERGFRGCLILRFKRKVFACHFRASDLDQFEGAEGFEEVWRRIMKFAPEDIPRVKLSEFEDLLDSKKVHERVDAFLSAIQV